MKRVAVTGMGVVTSLGDDWDTFSRGLREGRSGIQVMSEWDCYPDLNTRLAGPIPDFAVPDHYTRKQLRSMGRLAQMATRATEVAIIDAGLLGAPVLSSGDMGVAYGSSYGSVEAVLDFVEMLEHQSMSRLTATTYIRMMGHTAPVNVGVFFGLKGRIITTSSACTAGSQGIGSAYEVIKYGKQKVMVAGGSEELSPAGAAIFDTLYATSTKNDTPDLTPRPFDQDRDGLVIGEGAGSLILEEMSHATERGAKIYAELVGYGTNSDGGHVTQPNAETMGVAMALALEDAAITPDAVGYISAHGTATDRGDLAESIATAKLFGNKTPFSTLKGNLGHTLGACGAVEAWATIHMMNEGWFAPTLNLDTPDAACGDLEYIIGSEHRADCEYVVTNNFAFGGINTSLVFKRFE
ncbi:MAG: beta-ketoacyl-ACP synthase [Gammaproteobacteria bacterium]|nr:beta-ketoacyl-ACP synthase [Gammaproteobacteria bacterium]